MARTVWPINPLVQNGKILEFQCTLDVAIEILIIRGHLTVAGFSKVQDQAVEWN